jgi:hypothetical protein
VILTNGPAEMPNWIEVLANAVGPRGRRSIKKPAKAESRPWQNDVVMSVSDASTDTAFLHHPGDGAATLSRRYRAMEICARRLDDRHVCLRRAHADAPSPTSRTASRLLTAP